MFGLGLPELVIILVVVVILFSGGDKLSEIARGLGRFTGEFKRGKDERGKEPVGDNDKLSELSRGLGRFTGEFQRGKDEIEKVITKTKEELRSVKIPINRKV